MLDALHLHDTRGTALVNAWTARAAGVRRFDTAVGGLGGSPFAAGAGGNLATEDLVHLLDDAGIDSGIDLAGILEASRMLRAQLVKIDAWLAQMPPPPKTMPLPHVASIERISRDTRELCVGALGLLAAL